jgi:hypothetical protein
MDRSGRFAAETSEADHFYFMFASPAVDLMEHSIPGSRIVLK